MALATISIALTLFILLAPWGVTLFIAARAWWKGRPVPYWARWVIQAVLTASLLAVILGLGAKTAWLIIITPFGMMMAAILAMSDATSWLLSPLVVAVIAGGVLAMVIPWIWPRAGSWRGVVATLCIGLLAYGTVVGVTRTKQCSALRSIGGQDIALMPLRRSFSQSFTGFEIKTPHAAAPVDDIFLGWSFYHGDFHKGGWIYRNRDQEGLPPTEDIAQGNLRAAWRDLPHYDCSGIWPRRIQ